MKEAVAEVGELLSEEACVGVDTTSDVLQSFWPVVDGVEATHRGE